MNHKPSSEIALEELTQVTTSINQEQLPSVPTIPEISTNTPDIVVPRRSGRVVMVPYPAQGHINPAAAFAESLALHGLRVTLATTISLSKTATFHHTSIAIHPLSDGHEQVTQPETVEAYFARLKANLSCSLAAFLDECGHVKSVIYDSLMPWVLDIAHQRGLLGFDVSSEVLDWMARLWPVKTVGPTYLLLQKSKRSVSNHIINLFESKQDEACQKWLDAKGSGSVVYVSFGSLASLQKEQMEELAHGLAMSNCPFLWVVRASEMDKIKNLDLEKGLVVEWCHQPHVLAHSAVACFLSHCGWNSTLEALSHGVPLVAMPQQCDQPTNAMFVEGVWGFGIGVRAGEDGIVGREEIATRVKQVVEGDEGIELKKNACKWKSLADEAVEQGGTSATNIDEFVSTLGKIEK
ncbi:UDP glycosyltransferase 9-like [Salvia hispanica]|uniref:UDP glycosyltransferase 9-like n=1 Tax=Salvia hispanica TaxID=49212 RepID=UPI002009A400|nr:UDP glycosyltransferase 9-like [Salvia hispanica]